MTKKEIFDFISSIDSVNTEYIMQNDVIMKDFEVARKYLDQGKKDLYLLCMRQIREKIRGLIHVISHQQMQNWVMELL